jgi:hypothetical protein
MGKDFARMLLTDLIYHKSLPSKVDVIDQWWVISSAKDWLRKGQAASFEPFFRLIAFPERGQNFHRSEVLITAFCETVITADRDGVQVITGRDRSALPEQVQIDPAWRETGRLVAFSIGLSSRDPLDVAD